MNKITELNKLLTVIPDLEKRFGKDATQLKAFVDDIKDAAVKNPLIIPALFDTLTLVYFKALEGINKFKWFNPGSWDTFKAARIQCDEVARLMDFKRYKALRNL